jgi:hypothetical protein
VAGEPLLERCREESGSRVEVVVDSWAVGQPADAGGRMARVAVVVGGVEGKGEPDGSCRTAARLAYR